MDMHIRPYFSTSMTQTEVDSALFSRALELNDPPVGKKLLVNMGPVPGLYVFHGELPCISVVTLFMNSTGSRVYWLEAFPLQGLGPIPL